MIGSGWRDLRFYWLLAFGIGGMAFVLTTVAAFVFSLLVTMRQSFVEALCINIAGSLSIVFMVGILLTFVWVVERIWGRDR